MATPIRLFTEANRRRDAVAQRELEDAQRDLEQAIELLNAELDAPVPARLEHSRAHVGYAIARLAARTDPKRRGVLQARKGLARLAKQLLDAHKSLGRQSARWRQQVSKLRSAALRLEGQMSELAERHRPRDS